MGNTTQFDASGNPIYTLDSSGNAEFGGDLTLGKIDRPEIPAPDTLTLYTTDGTSVKLIDNAGTITSVVSSTPSFTDVTVTNDLTVQNSANIANTLDVGGDLNVTGDSALSGALGVTGNLSVTGIGQQKFVAKASSTARNTTVTPAADPELVLTVDANSTYMVDCVLAWTSGGGGFRADWTAPAGATMVWTDNDGAGVGALGTDVTFAATTGTSFAGALVVGGTAGSITLRWAQNTSNAADTTLLAGCYLSVRKVA